VLSHEVTYAMQLTSWRITVVTATLHVRQTALTRVSPNTTAWLIEMWETAVGWETCTAAGA